jgi:hypothetical protein
MRTLLWIAAAWAVMFLGIIAVDVGLTLSAGTAASSAVTQRIDFSPGAEGLIGWMERVSRRLDVVGREAFGRYTPLAELFIYGLVAPVLIAGPIGWEARRRQWPSRHALAVLAGAGALIGGWLWWTLPGLSTVFYALVRALLFCCRAIGLTYYAGSMVYFIFLPAASCLLYLVHRFEVLQKKDPSPL